MNCIRNQFGEKLDFRLSHGEPALRKSDWLIVLGHGVTGNLERPVIADTAAALNQAGFDTLRFSFAGNGDSEGDFRDSTISKEISDLDSVLGVAAKSYRNIAYIGHSMGSAVGVIQAARDSRIKALVSIAGMVDTRTFARTEFGDEIPDKGCMWEEASCPLSSAFMEDLCDTVVSVEPQVRKVGCPWLLFHGTADDVVSIRDTHIVENLKGESAKVILVEGADHSFNDAAHKQTLTEAVVSWFSQLEGHMGKSDGTV